MWTRLWIGLAVVVFGLCGLRLLADNDAPTTSLPVTRVVLTNAGYAYYHRAGSVDGAARVLVPTDGDVNDLLLTLRANDPSGQGPLIRYDTPKIFKIDVTANPTLVDLLGQVRGEMIELGAVKGRLVSVIEAKRDDMNKVVEDGAINVAAEDGLTSVPLSTVKKVKFTKPELQADFVAALEALAARNAGQQSVAVTFRGNGKRDVSIGYISDAPLWKPNYRLAVNADKGTLNGFAAVENTTEEDWKNVNLKLVSGRPVTFRMDLSEPLFVPRPFVEPALFASLRPPLYQGGFGNLGGQFGLQGGGLSALGGFGGGGQFGNSYVQRMRQRVVEQPATEATPKMVAVVDPVTTATAANLGEAFEYTITEPVTLAKSKSALLPFLNESVALKRLSIFNPQIHARYPLSGFQLKNTSKLFISQGPIAVYDGDTVVGQARLPDVKPGESHLLSYAIDLDAPITQEMVPTTDTLVSLTLGGGDMTEKSRQQSTQRTLVTNRGTAAKTVWITVPKRGDWKLLRPAAVETTPDLYRFEVTVKPGETTTLDVVEEKNLTHVLALATLPDSVIDGTMAKATTPAAVKAALEKLKAARAAEIQTRNDINAENNSIATVFTEQTRLRANMAAVPKDSEILQKFLKTLETQESEIATRRAKVKELEAKRDEQSKALAELMHGLKAE